MDLQTVDYMPVLNRIDEETSDVSKAVFHVYGSELLKESLAQESTAVAGTEKQKVTIVTEEKCMFLLAY